MKHQIICAILLLLPACERFSTKRKGENHTVSPEVQTIPETGIPTEVSALGQQQDAYHKCLEPLVTQAFADSLQSSIPARLLMVRHACNVLRSYHDVDERWSRECGISGQDDEVLVTVDAILRTLPIGVDDGYQKSANATFCSKGASAGYRRAWFQSMCDVSFEGVDITRATHQVLLDLSSDRVEAWRSCMASVHRGLMCLARNEPRGTLLELSVTPISAELVSFPLQVDYTNLTPHSPVPTSIGADKVSTYFSIADANSDASVTVMNRAAGGSVAACNYQIPAQEPVICSNGNAVGAISQTTRYSNIPLCRQLDKCELGRLEALYRGNINWEDYKVLVADQWSAFIATDGRAALAPCTP